MAFAPERSAFPRAGPFLRGRRWRFLPQELRLDSCKRLLQLRYRKRGFDDGVGVERHRLDACPDNELGELWIVRGRLAADADVFSFLVADRDDVLNEPLHRGIALVVDIAHNLYIPVYSHC